MTDASYISQAGSLEDKLKATIAQSSHEVAHCECFDSEQRAEIYTILETLKSNSETHRAMVKLITQKMKENLPDA